MMRGPIIRSAGGKLSIDGVELPGVCEEYSVDADPLSPLVQVRVTLLIARTKAPPAPAAFKDDGREHFTATFPGGAVTPSGKNACVTCLEAWPCSTEQHRRPA